MRKQILLFIILLIFTLSVSPQAERNSAPNKWERYRASNKNVSLLLPKMPIVIKSENPCRQLQTDTYVTYAQEVVYQFRITSKLKGAYQGGCRERVKFDQKVFENRINELKNSELKNVDRIEETKILINGKDVVKVSAGSTDYWMFDDLKNNRWFEMTVTHRSAVKPDVERFVNSLIFEENSDGIDVKKGADRILGDEIATNENENEGAAKQSSETEQVEGLVIVAKPRASYTDAARQAQVQGTVTLRVTFLANGGIGNITPTHELPYGLTEEAVSAAKKIAFLPQERNGKKINVVKQVQYTFTIY